MQSSCIVNELKKRNVEIEENDIKEFGENGEGGLWVELKPQSTIVIHDDADSSFNKLKVAYQKYLDKAKNIAQDDSNHTQYWKAKTDFENLCREILGKKDSS